MPVCLTRLFKMRIILKPSIHRILHKNSLIVSHLYLFQFKCKQTILILTVFSIFLFVYCCVFIQLMSSEKLKISESATTTYSTTLQTYFFKHGKVQRDQIKSKETFKGDKLDIEDVLRDKKETSSNFFDQDWSDENIILKRAENCENYYDNVPVFSFNHEIVQKEKKEFGDRATPLAFSHMLHHQVSIYEVFLAMYFRPINFYCIHVDVKANDSVRGTVEQLVKCYSNKTTTGKIFVLDKSESLDVRWGLLCTNLIIYNFNIKLFIV